MNRLFFIIYFLLLLLKSPYSLAQSLNDVQVMEYVKEGIRQGKSQEQLITELARKGVTREQAYRIKRQYEQQDQQKNMQALNKDSYESRLRTANQGSNINGRESDYDKNNRNDRGTNLFSSYRDSTTLFTNDSLLENLPSLPREEQVFGRDIFNTKNLTFEPSVNLATPPNYRLGPGDEVIIDIWGASQNTIRQQISPDGIINIEKIGPVYLSGLTVAESNDYLRKALNKIYNGLADEADPTSEIRLSLGNSRTIQIHVMGEVVQPGTYALSSFSTVLHALYRAGGVSDIGSLRNVRLVRNGSNVAMIDVYEFILQGRTGNDISLQEGDVVIVPAYDLLVQISGKVKRPMRFEMKKGESLSTLINYAGSFDSDAYTQTLRVVRQNGQEYEINTVKDVDYENYQMHNGDVVSAEAILRRFTNKLEIRGAVHRPGIYQLNDKLNTVRALINEANGLRGDAFLNRAVLYRERENLTNEVLSVNLDQMVKGLLPDIVLFKNDILYIPSIHDLQDLGDLTIHGEVANPGLYPYADNITLEDLIIRAGGLKEAASTVRVDVARRIKDPQSTVSNDSIGKMYSFALKECFVVDGQPGFILQPYDEVYVRRSPGYQAQQNVEIGGEILFGGTYAMTNREERISHIIRKAGGATDYAYLRGAKLTRKADDSEKKRMADAIRLLKRQLGEAMFDSLDIKVENTFTVGIDLEKALTNPGSSEDILLREGDLITIPKLNNTVMINGAVMVPNTVSYVEDQNINYYLNQSGGYADNAKKRKKFIIYMNGQVTKVKGNGKGQIEPGCEIIVPSKSKERVGLAGILSVASSLSSLGVMAASMANLIRR